MLLFIWYNSHWYNSAVVVCGTKSCRLFAIMSSVLFLLMPSQVSKLDLQLEAMSRFPFALLYLCLVSCLNLNLHLAIILIFRYFLGHFLGFGQQAIPKCKYIQVTRA